MLETLLTAAVLAFVGSRLAVGARIAVRRGVREHLLEVVGGIRARHLLLAPVAFTLVIAAFTALIHVPGLDVGWWTAIGGSGNPVIGVTDQTTGSPLERILPAVFLVLLLPALPLFVEREERIFRLGAEHWSTARRIRRGIWFGLVHAVVGIPIGAALALSIGGWYFTWAYLRAWRRTHDQESAVLESTRAHLAYNLEILVLVGLALGFGW